MTAFEYLFWYKKESTQLIKNLLDGEIKITKKLSPILVDDLTILKDFMSRGKKIRGGLMNLGIHLAKSSNIPNKIFKSSLSYEFLHSALLMQDDVIDRDEVRRGFPTVHVKYIDLHKKKYSNCTKDSYHFGISRTICLSDWALFYCVGLIADSDFDAESKVSATKILYGCALQTGYGQALDVTYESLPTVSEKEILLMLDYKAARYTLSDPLRCGYALGGGVDKAVDKALFQYGQNIGIAFQITDDILGIFGDVSKLGKPVGSDLKARKNTLLIAKSLEMGNKKQKDFIKSVWGKKDITKEEFKKAKEVIKQTGALKYSKDLSENLLQKGISYVPKITKDTNYQNLLKGFATLAVKREK